MTDIRPTMDDRAVMDFIWNGYVLLEGVVPDQYNQRFAGLPGGRLNELAYDADFLRHVLLHPQTAGVARSLLGADFLVPSTVHHHLYEAAHTGQTWHSDGLSEYGHGVNHLQCYYYPQEVGPEDGPTMVLPGSHQRLIDREAIAHYGDILGQLSLTVAAGSVVMTHYGIWHKAGPKFNDQRRTMLKYSYFRTAPPARDWLLNEEKIPPYQNPGRHPYVTEVESYRTSVRGRRTWDWLCGQQSADDPSHGAKIFVGARPLQQAVAEMGA